MCVYIASACINTLALDQVPGLFKDTEAVVRNLDEGTEYDFKVTAVNDLGDSDSLETDDAIEAKHPFSL